MSGNIRIVKNLKGQSLSGTMAEKGIAFPFPCSGSKTCGRCKVRLLKGEASLSPEERGFLTEDEIRNGVRLACFLPNNEMEIEVSVSCAEHESLYVNSKSDAMGLAIDIGTTTIAMFLTDMKERRVLSAMSRLNNQTVFGADVVSRMMLAMKSSEILRNTLLKQLNAMIKEIGGNVTTVAITANTVMTHFLLGYSTDSMATAPFTPEFTGCYEGNCNDIGIVLDASLIVAPCISAFVGGDIVAGIYASGMQLSKETNLLVDLGTNGEMALGGVDGILCCSTAAGPAFEGRHISCGMGGVAGAINSYTGGKVPSVTTVGGEYPIGICGSGLVDIVAAMLKDGIIDESGRMKSRDGIYTVFEDVHIAQNDIREIQMAKAAISAGAKALAKRSGIELEYIANVYLAGAFGNHMSSWAAVAIGLIPRELEDKLMCAGNLSGKGALKMLYDDRCTKAFDAIKAKAKTIELSDDETFKGQFINDMNFCSGSV